MNGAEQSTSPKVVTYEIKTIETYQVTDDELRRLADGYGQVGQDLTFSVASASVAVSLLAALFTANLSQAAFVVFMVIIVTCLALSVYTGMRWWRTRAIGPQTIRMIRARKAQQDP